jgi:hypothetical protein
LIMTRRNQEFQTIHSEGGLLPSDILRRVLNPRDKLDGTQPGDYGLPKGERLNEVITQSWNRLLKHWAEFSKAYENLPENKAGTGLTNDKWSLPLMRELGFGLLPTSSGPEIEGRTYAINRFFGPVPIHLIGCGLSLDRRTAGARGAATVNPHGLVQEFLNRSDDHLWAIVSNGLRIRILRDNLAMSRQSFLEFDLESMFAGEVYSDFVLLWLTVHATKFSPLEAGRLETCWLEKWTKLAEEQGTRALGDLRGGVEMALQVLGEGITSHPKNTALRDSLRGGQVSLTAFHGQLLRVIYRLIFLFVAEDRTIDGNSLLHPVDASEAGRKARECYATHYSTARLREIASKIKGSRHGDLWRQFQLLIGALSGADDYSEVRKHLGLPVLGSFLWDPDYTAVLNNSELTNYDFLEVLRNLCFTRQGYMLRPVDYKNLGAEELGGVYESLLALTPQISGDGERFSFAEFAGSERKTSGSYYTPDSLVQCLLDSALDPVVEEAIKGKESAEAEKAILKLKVCDPAVGSGHFLVGAAHRLARHLARVRALAQGESEPSPLLYQHALRDVIGRCLYGVDINPMSAELCRVSLWLEALEPGKPLSFLDHHIRVGNSLLGTTPELIAKGLPDDAFKPIEGDDRQACTRLKRRNRSEREGLGPLFVDQETEIQTKLAEASAALELLPDDRSEDIRAKELAFSRYEETEEYCHKKILADTWCAAFVFKKYFNEPGRDSSAYGITQNHIAEFVAGSLLPKELQKEVGRLSDQYQFFHWHLSFPEVFASGGFDCVLANPPWEKVKIQEKEWFARQNPEIAIAPNAAVRKRLIQNLKTEDPELFQNFLKDVRKAEGESHFLRDSGRFPLCGRGDVNLYTVFAEDMRSILNSKGRVGCVLPTGIATDDTTKYFFQDVMDTKSLVSLFDFENRLGFFPAVDSRMKFCLFTTGRGLQPVSESAMFVFFAHVTEDLIDPERCFTLSVEDIFQLNPNTKTCPIFRLQRDAELTKAIYRRTPVLIREAREDQPEENPWGIKFLRMLDMANDSKLFRAREQLESEGWQLKGSIFRRGEEEYLPLIEGKMFMPYDHRYADVVFTSNVGRHGQPKIRSLNSKFDPLSSSLPEYWVPSEEVMKFKSTIGSDYFAAFKAITSVTNERTSIATILPFHGIHDNAPIVIVRRQLLKKLVSLIANLNSFAFDYCARQKMGTVKLMYYVFYQLPIFAPSTYISNCPWAKTSLSLYDWILPRVLELTYTAWDLESFSRDCGWSGSPFLWDEERRFLLRNELDAAFFHLYLPTDSDGNWRQADSETVEELDRLRSSFLTPREAVDYIMETFIIIKRKDIKKYGDYRTKLAILGCYDKMQEAMKSGNSYQTSLDPPPSDPLLAHPNSL